MYGKKMEANRPLYEVKGRAGDLTTPGRQAAPRWWTKAFRAPARNRDVTVQRGSAGLRAPAGLDDPEDVKVAQRREWEDPEQ